MQRIQPVCHFISARRLCCIIITFMHERVHYRGWGTNVSASKPRTRVCRACFTPDIWPSRSMQGYKQVCGFADVWGDGIIPLESAHLDGAQGDLFGYEVLHILMTFVSA